MLKPGLATSDRNAACLTIMESASALGLSELTPGVLDDLCADRHAAVVQQADEPPWEFAVRVARRVRALVASGSCVRLAVVVTNGHDDAPTVAARWWITRALLPAIQRSGSARFILRAPETIGDGARHVLFALAGTVAAEVGAVGEVSVVFGPSALFGGVQPVVADSLGQVASGAA